MLGKPLLKRALSRREKHEVLFEAAILALGRDKTLKQQSVQSLTESPTESPETSSSLLGRGVGILLEGWMALKTSRCSA